MLCKVCIQGLQGIWDPTKTTRVCLLKDLSAQYRQQLPQYPVNTHMISDQHNSLELSCPEKYVFAHHRTQESLRASILEGCVMCQVFTNHLEADTHHPPVHGYYSLFTVSCQGGTTMMHICVNGSCIGLELCRYVENKNWKVNVGSSTGDDSTWEVVHEWVDKCTTYHDHCNDAPAPAREASISMPSRLIYLEPAATTADTAGDSFRIVLGNTVDSGSRYIALSHCCDGTNANIDSSQLTQSSLAQFYASQPTSILPLTFRDTLVAAKRLGISYVWIDILCVLQDDWAERKREDNRRPDIFQNAFITIGASGARHVSSGLFNSRDSFRTAPTVFDLPIDAEGTVRQYISAYEYSLAWKTAMKVDWRLFYSTGGLVDRLFSRRMVHFGTKMVFWECHRALCAEIHPYGVDEAGPLGNPKIPFNTIMEISRHHDIYGVWLDKPWKSLLNVYPTWQQDGGSIYQVIAGWICIIELYSACKTATATATASEKLSDLEHIVNHTKVMLKERGSMQTRYIAGMWGMTLPAALLWAVYRPSRRHISGKIPSWSWASIDGRIIHSLPPVYETDSSMSVSLCRIIQTSTCEDMEGHLMIEGKIALIQLDPLYYWTDIILFELSYTITGEDGIATASHTEEQHRSLVFFQLDSMPTSNDARNEYLCMPVRIYSEVDGWYVQGLIVLREKYGYYKRHGVWWIKVSSAEEGQELFKDIDMREICMI